MLLTDYPPNKKQQHEKSTFERIGVTHNLQDETTSMQAVDCTTISSSLTFYTNEARLE